MAFTAPTPTAETATAEEEHARPWTILWLVAVAQFMVILDVTVVNVALPSIGAALRFEPADLQWVVTAYVLLTGGLLLLGGRASDALGRRRLFLAGLTVFTGASLASGLAPSPEALILARGIQGLGAAMLSPAALSIITTAYEGRQRTLALSVWGAIGGAGAAAGVLFGGMLTSWLSWEWIFFINVPVGVIAGLLALRVIEPASAAAGVRQLDLPGALALTAGLVVLVYAVEGTTTHGWDSTRTLALLGLSAATLGAFALIERRVARPLVPAGTWRIRSLISSATLMFGATAILIAAFFLNSLYLQEVMGASALEAGLAFLPFALIIALTARLGTHLLAHLGARVVVIGGLSLAAGGALVLAGVPDGAAYAADLLPGFLLLGAGIGLVFVTISVTAMADVTQQDAGLASGMMMTAHEIGAALGVAAMSAIATAGITATEGFADGYRDGFTAAAWVAAALIALAAAAVPAARPDPQAAPATAH